MLIRWFFLAVATAVVATIVNEIWLLIKAGAIFDFIESSAGELRDRNFIRGDLVSSAKQSVAQWILAISCIAGWIATLWSKSQTERLDESLVFGIGYGFTLGLGILFLLSNFERFRDIHLAIGNAQYALAGIAMVSTVAMAIIQRIRDKHDIRSR